jgi:hypothetical protein
VSRDFVDFVASCMPCNDEGLSVEFSIPSRDGLLVHQVNIRDQLLAVREESGLHNIQPADNSRSKD